ncbi:MAG TPA: metallopeptidase TldD-related protein [Acidimicrobiales bacterium]|nr:metallopeptidase TldD-related protein [Acidimicrobiales bacterium]
MSGRRGDDLGAGLAPADEVVERALERAGGAGAVVLVEDSSDAEVRFANNTTTTNGTRRDRRVTVISLAPVAGGTAVGVARRGGDVDLAEVVAAAEADAASSPPADDGWPLVTPGDRAAAGRAGQDPDFADPPVLTGLGVLHDVVAGLAGAFARAEAADRVLAGFAEHHLSTLYLGTSAGLRLRHVQPTGALHLVGRSTDGARSAWAGTGAPDFAGVAVEDLERRVVRGLDWARRRVDLDAGRYEVVIPPEAVADLMVGVVEAASGKESEEGRTVFSGPDGSTRLGAELSRLPFELRSDPGEAGLECTPFLATPVSGPDDSVFDNGLALARTDWIEAGRLHRLRYHRAGAAAAGAPAAPPIDNLVLDLPGAQGSVEDLVARTERGLLLTCLWYIREVDPQTLLLTGLTRDGVYLVEGGEITGAVNNFRWNESPVDLLGRATEAGASVRALGREFGEWYNRTAMPPLRVPDFNMSSVSPAS